MLFEVCCDTVESARVAARCGTRRVELCSGLKLGGLTPSRGVTQRVCKMMKLEFQSRTQVMVLIRPRPGDFTYDEDEIESMLVDIEDAARAGADGVVIGALTRDAAVDTAALDRMMAKCRDFPGLDVTFHRAFDLCRDLTDSLGRISAAGIGRVLTSGGKDSVVSAGGKESLARLVQHSRAEGLGVAVMAGGGVTCANAADVARETGCQELHGSLKRSHATDMGEWLVADEAQVLQMKAIVDAL